jgi:uncharacterized membrane protein
MFNTAHLHPMIVHFPIALLTVGFFAEVSVLFYHDGKYLSKTGFYLLITGAVAAIAAWSTGQLFTNEPTQGAILEIFKRHETGALVTMILAVAAAAFRLYLVVAKKEESSLRWIALGVYCLAFLAVTFTGFMGGTMVYNYMMAL